MPIELACLMAVTAALLAASVCAVLWRGKTMKPSTLPVAVARPSSSPQGQEDPASDPPVYAPPEAALLTAQLEVGQMFLVQTRSAKYTLTLLDPTLGLYDAVRVGLKKGGKSGTERFQMLFAGTFVPGHGLRFGAFVMGGNLSYRRVRNDGVESVSPSTPVIRILFSIPESYRQAS